MNLGDCIQLIGHVYLPGDQEAMCRVGIELLRRLKYEVYLEQPYPRSGWFLTICEQGPSLANGDVKIAVDLAPKSDSPSFYGPSPT